MTDRDLVPPGFSEAVLRRVLPATEAEVVLGELREGFSARSERDGPRSARRWHGRQTLGFFARAATLRALSTVRGREGGGMFEEIVSDVRWALRGLRKRPTFTAVAVGTLALGIGANSAIFTLVSAHFFESLPYERPDELVLVWETGRNNMEVNTVAPGNYHSWRDEAGTLEDIAAYNVDFATISGDPYAERVAASVVVPHFFDVLGVTPVLGRAFDDASAREADGLQVVMSHALWTSRYGADPAVLGRDIRIDGRPHTVLGVLPADYRQPERSLSWQATQLWRPMLLDGGRGDYDSRYLRTIARRRPNTSVEQTRTEMTALYARLTELFPEGNGGRSVLVRTLDEYLMGAARPTLVMLLLAGVAVLLIVCANVANLTLARGEERRREFAVRAALGSGRSRLLRQVIVEGVVLALAGAAVGTVFVYAAGGPLQALQARFFTGLVDVAVDWRVIAFTTAVAVGSGVVFGLPLARSAARPDLRDALIEGGARAGAGARSGATRNLLIIGQVGLATTLLVVALLLGRSFNALVNVPPGFEPEGVVTFEVSPPQVGYEERDDMLGYHRTLRDQLAAIPGVTGVGMVSDLMFTTENMSATFTIDGREPNPDAPPRSEYHVAAPEYFEVLGIPLVRGEPLPSDWEARAEMPVVVNERFADAHFPDSDAIGARLWFSWRPEQAMRVVGVVGDVLDDGYDADADPAMYLAVGDMPRRRISYVLRASGDPATILTDVRSAVGRVDPDVPAGNLRLLSGMMAETVARPRAASLIGLAFALIALLVSSAGIYGVLSYLVQARTRELGIRTALGASGRQLLAMVMQQSGRLIVAGLALGTLGALVTGRYLASLLFGVRSWDPVSLVGAVLVLGASGVLASWVPARRAVAVDPREALRAE